MAIHYCINQLPDVQAVIGLYEKAALPRPIQNKERMGMMFKNSNLIVTAWDGDKLVGLSRSITDWAWSCYLADLAVDPNYQKLGIGKKLVDLTKQEVGDQVMILLLSVPSAMTYYPKIGFDKEDRSFAIPRKK